MVTTGVHSIPIPLLKISSRHRADFLGFFWPICRDSDPAFERLVSARVSVGVSAASSTPVAKDFLKCRSSVEREEVKRTVEELGTMSLEK